MKTLVYIFTAALLLNLSTVGAAETMQEKGRRIAAEAYERSIGFGDFTVSGRMILRSPQGQESTRGFRLSGIELEDNAQKNLLVFEWPPDIRDVALLTVNQPQGADQQWLYLPALRRVKRISTANRTGSFAGSELSYEDFVTSEVDRFTYQWIRAEACPNLPELSCNVVERLPVDTYSGYKRQIVWLDESEYRIHRIDYHDRRDERLKTLSVEDYEKYHIRHWRPTRMLMSNYQNGRSTELQWSEYQFDNGLQEDNFSVRALERTR